MTEQQLREKIRKELSSISQNTNEAKQRKLSSTDMDKIEQVVDDAETAFMRLPSSETWMEDYNTDDMVKILTDYYNRSEYRNKKLQDILDLFDVKKQSPDE